MFTDEFNAEGNPAMDYSIPSRGCRNTPRCLTLKKPKISPSLNEPLASNTDITTSHHLSPVNNSCFRLMLLKVDFKYSTALFWKTKTKRHFPIGTLGLG